MKLPVAIAYAHNGTLCSEFADSLMALLQRYEIESRISLKSGPRIASSRNKMVTAYLENSRAPYLLMLDSDMTFDSDLVTRLLEYGHHPIVGGLCFGLHGTGETFPVLFNDDLTKRRDYPENKLIKVGATGAACLLIQRKVLETLAKRHGAPFTWFQDTVRDGKDTGEDVEFCLRARKAGFPIRVHTGIKLGHVKSLVVTEGLQVTGAVNASVD